MASKGSFQLKRFYDFLQVIINPKKESQQQKPQPTDSLLQANLKAPSLEAVSKLKILQQPADRQQSLQVPPN